MKRTDEQLLLELARGDKSAFREIYQTWSPAIYRLVKRMIAAKSDDYDEVFQEVMLRIWKNAPLYDSAKGRAKGWIYLVATRHCLNWLESKSTRCKARESELDESAPDVDKPGPEEIAARNEDAKRAVELLNHLPDDLKQVITLRHLEDLSIDEIAEIAQVPAGTVKSRIFYGLKKLRSFFFKENSHEEKN
ncbi:MAG: RNA polymerase sigma factor [Candidatus Riflebacteria bacterium]|nr:RNA polymerase sigma factor [Candidatus Riflebacteria bacterium]